MVVTAERTGGHDGRRAPRVRGDPARARGAGAAPRRCPRGRCAFRSPRGWGSAAAAWPRWCSPRRAMPRTAGLQPSSAASARRPLAWSRPAWAPERRAQRASSWRRTGSTARWAARTSTRPSWRKRAPGWCRPAGATGLVDVRGRERAPARAASLRPFHVARVRQRPRGPRARAGPRRPARGGHVDRHARARLPRGGAGQRRDPRDRRSRPPRWRTSRAARTSW